jgi:hypothetical protein
MTKYFDKLLKIKIYKFCYPLNGNRKNNLILGRVNFFWNSLDIINKNILVENSLRCTKILLECHLFKKKKNLVILPCKETFMDDYDGILNCNGLKYSPSKIFDNFLFIIFYGRKSKGIVIRTRPFSSCVVHLKGFSPYFNI